MDKPLIVWRIYDNPIDSPGWFVARAREVTAAESRWTHHAIMARTLRDVQRHLPAHLICVGPSPGEDRRIVEVWL